MAELSSELSIEEKAPSGWPEFPWLTILIQPRKTIRAIVGINHDRYVILLVILTGVTSGISNAINNNGGARLPFTFLLLLGAVIGPIGALIGWMIGGALYRLSGDWFGCEATTAEVRAAMAWSAVPYIMTLVLWLPLLLLYGTDLFTGSVQQIEQNPLPLLISSVLMLASSAWWYFLFWKCYAEVQRLSLYKAFVAIIIPTSVIIVGMMGCFTLTALGP